MCRRSITAWRSARDFNYFKVRDPTDYSGDPAWVKVCIALGSVLAVAAFGIFGYTLFTDNPALSDPNFGETPSGIPIAGAAFFLGL